MLDGAVPERKTSMRPIDSDLLMKTVFNDVVLVDGEVKGVGLILAETVDKAPTINAVPIEELEHLRNELYEHDLITMEGLKQLNTLIKKYTTVHEGDVNNG